MQAERLTKIKRLISRLNHEELSNLSSFLSKKKNEAWLKLRVQKIQEHNDKISSLLIGSKVLFTDTRYDLAGIVAKVTGHGRKKTYIEIEGKAWNCPRNMLSVNITEENIVRVKAARKAATAMNKIFSEAMGNVPDKRPLCRACWQRLDKGESKRFLDKKIFRKSGQKFYTILHRHRKDCSKKSKWSKIKKRLSEIR